MKIGASTIYVFVDCDFNESPTYFLECIEFNVYEEINSYGGNSNKIRLNVEMCGQMSFKKKVFSYAKFWDSNLGKPKDHFEEIAKEKFEEARECCDIIMLKTKELMYGDISEKKWILKNPEGKLSDFYEEELSILDKKEAICMLSRKYASQDFEEYVGKYYIFKDYKEGHMSKIVFVYISQNPAVSKIMPQIEITNYSISRDISKTHSLYADINISNKAFDMSIIIGATNSEVKEISQYEYDSAFNEALLAIEQIKQFY